MKDTKFCRESKAFIHISNIASFKPFLIVWWWEYCTFSDSSVVSFKSSPWPNYSTELFSKKNQVLPSSFFSSSNMSFIRLFLANTWLPGLFPHKATNCREMWSWIRKSLSGWRIGAVGTGMRHKMTLVSCAERLCNAKPGNHLK